MRVILKTVVGSRLHQLHNENSDYDYRGIFVHDLADLLSPFKKLKNTSWIEGDEDNTSYELRDFCKFATMGNNTILEILWSNLEVMNTHWGKKLQNNRQRFLHSERIYQAHKGYAESQYRKMNLFTPDKRTPKFAVAYLRVLQQGIQLLQTGDFDPVVTQDRDFLLDVKYNFNNSLIPELGRKFTEYQVAITDAYIKNPNKFTPDYAWIEKFIYDTYMGVMEWDD